MKIRGKKILGANREIIAIPRGDGEDIVFVAEAVLDHKPFDKMCPVPKPRLKKIDGQDVPDFDDKNYNANVLKYSEKKTAWLILTALKATPELEWEQINFHDPSTWSLFRKELNDSGISELEVNRIINGALTAQGLNEARIESARNSFLAREARQLAVLSSLKDEPKNTLSGEVASGTESDPGSGKS